jgi:hypothetical protein
MIAFSRRIVAAGSKLSVELSSAVRECAVIDGGETLIDRWMLRPVEGPPRNPGSFS